MMELVNHIRKTYPNGCNKYKKCRDGCALRDFEEGTLEYAVCQILDKLSEGLI